MANELRDPKWKERPIRDFADAETLRRMEAQCLAGNHSPRETLIEALRMFLDAEELGLELHSPGSLCFPPERPADPGELATWSRDGVRFTIQQTAAGLMRVRKDAAGSSSEPIRWSEAVHDVTNYVVEPMVDALLDRIPETFRTAISISIYSQILRHPRT